MKKRINYFEQAKHNASLKEQKYHGFDLDNLMKQLEIKPDNKKKTSKTL